LAQNEVQIQRTNTEHRLEYYLILMTKPNQLALKSMYDTCRIGTGYKINKKSSFCYKKPIFAFSFSRGATFSQLKALKRRFIAKVANL
jgi:hypothetical protein